MPPFPAALRAALLALLLLAAAVVPQFVPRDDVLNLLFRLCLFVVLAQSWNIVGGLAGQTSLGHAAFFGIGALVTRWLWLDGWPFALAFLAGGLAAALFALVIGVPTFRLRGAYFAIGTLGIAEALRLIVGQRLPLITTLPAAEIASYNPAARYYLALAVALAVSGGVLLLRRLPVGLGLAALRADEGAASATGVPVLAHKLLALLISSAFAGLAGGLFAYQQVSYYPVAPFDPAWTFNALLVTYIGGLGTIAGPVIGALFFVLAQDQLALLFAQESQVIFGVLFILVVLIFPGGIVGGWQQLMSRKPAWLRRIPRPDLRT